MARHCSGHELGVSEEQQEGRWPGQSEGEGEKRVSAEGGQTVSGLVRVRVSQLL